MPRFSCTSPTTLLFPLVLQVSLLTLRIQPTPPQPTITVELSSSVRKDVEVLQGLQGVNITVVLGNTYTVQSRH